MSTDSVAWNEGDIYYDLEPCPFCKEDKGYIDFSSYYVSVLCDSCDARGSRVYGTGGEETQKAVDKWNDARC